MKNGKASFRFLSQESRVPGSDATFLSEFYKSVSELALPQNTPLLCMSFITHVPWTTFKSLIDLVFVYCYAWIVVHFPYLAYVYPSVITVWSAIACSSFAFPFFQAPAFGARGVSRRSAGAQPPISRQLARLPGAHAAPAADGTGTRLDGCYTRQRYCFFVFIWDVISFDDSFKRRATLEYNRFAFWVSFVKSLIWSIWES